MNPFGHRFQRRRRQRELGGRIAIEAAQPTLAGVAPGEKACLLSFAPNLAQERKAQLQAYGLVPGRWVKVLQNWPVIVVEVEHTEIALENELASQMWVSGD